MKQKIVIRVCMNKGQKSRAKAMKIAVRLPGVEKVAVGGKENDEIEVTGEGVDAAKLTTLLRKNVGFATLESVDPVDQQPSEKEKKIESLPLPLYCYYPIHDPQYSCAIL